MEKKTTAKKTSKDRQSWTNDHETRRYVQHKGSRSCTRNSPNQTRPHQPPVKLQSSSRARQSLEVITEEVAQQYTRRRKQLIPRARLVQQKRADDPIRRVQTSRSPSLYAQVIPRIRPHPHEVSLLLTPPPDFRTDDYISSEGSSCNLSRSDDYKHKQALLDRELFKTADDKGLSNSYRKHYDPASDLIGIPLKQPIYRTRVRNNSAIYEDPAAHSLKIEYLDPKKDHYTDVSPLPKRRIDDRTIVRHKGSNRKKSNVTTVTVTISDFNNREDIYETFSNGTQCNENSVTHNSTYSINEFSNSISQDSKVEASSLVLRPRGKRQETTQTFIDNRIEILKDHTADRTESHSVDSECGTLNSTNDFVRIIEDSITETTQIRNSLCEDENITVPCASDTLVSQDSTAENVKRLRESIRGTAKKIKDFTEDTVDNTKESTGDIVRRLQESPVEKIQVNENSINYKTEEIQQLLDEKECNNHCPEKENNTLHNLTSWNVKTCTSEETEESNKYKGQRSNSITNIITKDDNKIQIPVCEEVIKPGFSGGRRNSIVHTEDETDSEIYVIGNVISFSEGFKTKVIEHSIKEKTLDIYDTEDEEPETIFQNGTEPGTVAENGIKINIVVEETNQKEPSICDEVEKAENHEESKVTEHLLHAKNEINTSVEQITENPTEEINSRDSTHETEKESEYTCENRWLLSNPEANKHRKINGSIYGKPRRINCIKQKSERRESSTEKDSGSGNSTDDTTTARLDYCVDEKKKKSESSETEETATTHPIFVKHRKGTMSRRPQVLKIKDSTTTSRSKSGDRNDVAGYGLIRTRSVEIDKDAERDVAFEETSKNLTRKMRSIFEGGRNQTHTPSSEDEVPTQTKEKVTYETSEANSIACDQVTKPMLIATLSVEDSSDTSDKSSKRSTENSSPEQDLDSSINICKTKTPAFRAFSCNGQERLCTIGKSVPDILEVTQKKSDKKELYENKLHKRERNSKVAAFDGLLQYLQDYRHGLRELLVNNNVVIIEPVRQSKVRLEDRKYATMKSTSESTCRITGATIKKSEGTSATSPTSNTLPRQLKSQQPILRRHFFYHPIRTNRELVDEELPDPDKVRHAREIFERSLKMKSPTTEELNSKAISSKNDGNASEKISAMKSENKISIKSKRKYLTVDTVFRHNVLHRRWTDSGSLSSGVSSDLSCYETDLESPSSRADTISRNSSHKEGTPDVFSSDDNEYIDEADAKNYYLDDVDEGHYVPPEVLEKIRACGTTVTYYGGRVISVSNGPVRSPMTLAIMDEIRNSHSTIKRAKGTRIIQDGYFGVKFRLVKSNSCGSRLELAGTEDEEKFKVVNRIEEISLEDDVNDDERKHNNSEEVKSENSTTHSDNEGKKLEENENVFEQRNSETTAIKIGHFDTLFSKLNERTFANGNTNTYDSFVRGGPHKLWFSPEKAKLVEKKSNVLFDEMEFEEFEIAEDSLNVIQERDTETNNTEKNAFRQDQDFTHSHAINNESELEESKINGSDKESQLKMSKANDDVPMTTWATRSVLFDFRNSETDGSHLPTKTISSDQTSC